MRKTLLSLLIVVLTLTAKAQNAKLDASGNYVATSKSKEPPIETGKTYTDTKGVKYPVYKNSKGKLFVLKTSKKTNKEYKSYLKLEGK